MRLAWLILGCAAIGCSSSHGSGAPPDMAMPVAPDAMPIRIIEAKVSAAAGIERYLCQWTTVPQDIYIVRIVAVSPTVVHHAVLSIENNVHPDGPGPCDSFSSSWQTFFASGVNSPELDLPNNVAFKISAGQQIVLDLHVLNATQAPVEDIAAVDVIAASDTSQLRLANATWAGNAMFTIPSSMQVDGTCTLTQDASLFAIYPHMHETGTHMTVSLAGSVNQVVWDQDFDPNDQKFGSWALIPLKQGDQLKVTCGYSPAGIGRTFGNTSNQEMCFAISYFTPPIAPSGGTSVCIF
jgi:hypothetical protein